MKGGDDKHDYLLKVLTLGECGVGKTSIILRYVDNKFNKNHLITIGLDFKVKLLNIKGRTVKMKIWDTAGQERFRSISRQYYRGSDGIVLVYDVGDRNSFEKVSGWINQIHGETDSNVVCILVGNKSDFNERKVSTEEGKNLANDFGLDFYETSALKNLNITECFDDLVWRILKIKDGFLYSPRSSVPAPVKPEVLIHPKEKENQTIITKRACCSS